LFAIIRAVYCSPKVESAEEIFKIDSLLCTAEKKNDLETGNVEVAILCESAKGLENIYRIISAKPEYHQMSLVGFGAADFTLDWGISLTKEGKELEYARSRLPVACLAAGIMPPLDSPWMIDIEDTDGLIAEVGRAKSYGFQKKLVIHPNQIEPCHDVFTPTEDEITEAARIVEAFMEAELDGKAALQLDGRFIDYAVLEKSEKNIRPIPVASSPPRLLSFLNSNIPSSRSWRSL
jgi:citrate lyase subunit beta/citryl-CoA lyase